ncbi:tlde1 domain-containing protein [Photobacterium sanguinicancri]|uniref:DUF2778 domain-containing protein n=1 Tax=Photobacterium sanguinicancri TaxID=875932 RepID=A0AAW7YB53_9GAMM|nr:tlde1 domain-containing protein [Photobacterium sanguinicancri]MDO6545557.1 DUF2778 domain-containing protein [Photobacterium sanguinicancri]
MSWQYAQATGELYFNGEFVATGYSGKAEYKNKPKMQHMKNLGPIPRGEYKIHEPRRSPRTGPYVLPLSPVGHGAWNRTDFQIHGDSIKNPGTASSGCIILPRNIREKIWGSGERKLIVIEKFD